MKIKANSYDFSIEEMIAEEHERFRRLVASAKNGIVESIRDIGCLYIWGENGFPKDHERARYWYSIAADHGNTEAMWDVFIMYFNGEGGPVDIEKGMFHLQTAALRKR